MPFYRYEHDCGYSHTQFLKQDRDSVVLKCLRCNKGVSARRVRDKNSEVHEKDEVRGVFRRESGGNHASQH